MIKRFDIYSLVGLGGVILLFLLVLFKIIPPEANIYIIIFVILSLILRVVLRVVIFIQNKNDK
ncbi:MAG: hypothetical protein NTX22_06865 [Ignavibacteriales bacterium]|nr:hypothetical protein [Ignavibacteriales bacterium]